MSIYEFSPPPVAVGGVTSLNSLTGALSLLAGTNITLTPAGNTLTIDAAGTPSVGAAGAIQMSDGAGAFIDDTSRASASLWNGSATVNELYIGKGVNESLVITHWANGNGTGTPYSDFHFYAATTNQLTLNELGNMGLGTNAPSAQLHTTGSLRFASLGAGLLTADASGNITSVPGGGGTPSDFIFTNSSAQQWNGTGPALLVNSLVIGATTFSPSYLGSSDVPVANTTNESTSVALQTGFILEATSIKESGIVEILSGFNYGLGATGTVGLFSGDIANAASVANTGSAQLTSGATSGSGNSGPVQIFSGNSTSGGSGNVLLETGSAKNSGSINLVIANGTAGGSTGNITLDGGLPVSVVTTGDIANTNVITNLASLTGIVSGMYVTSVAHSIVFNDELLVMQVDVANSLVYLAYNYGVTGTGSDFTFHAPAGMKTTVVSNSQIEQGTSAPQWLQGIPISTLVGLPLTDAWGSTQGLLLGTNDYADAAHKPALLLIQTGAQLNPAGAHDTGEINIVTGESWADHSTGNVIIRSGYKHDGDGDSGSIQIATGGVDSAANAGFSSGALSLSTATTNNTSGLTGGVTIATGAQNGSGISGSIALSTGAAAGGTRGIISTDGITRIGANSTTLQHELNSALATPATDVLTLLTGPAGKAGNPAGYIQIMVNGTPRVIPFW